MNAVKKWSLYCQKEQRKSTEGVVGKKLVKLKNCKLKIGLFNHKEAKKLKDSTIEVNLLTSKNSTRINQLKNNNTERILKMSQGDGGKW